MTLSQLPPAEFRKSKGGAAFSGCILYSHGRGLHCSDFLACQSTVEIDDFVIFEGMLMAI
jgi:hypothetical protein